MSISEALVGKVEALTHDRIIRRALALHRRGEVRRDGLEPSKVSTRLEIQWHARDVHPWDRNLGPERKARLFVEQSIDDAEAAIRRLFAGLPHVEALDVSVLGPDDAILLGGTVHRSSLDTSASLESPRMRLRELGLGGQVFDNESMLSIYRRAS